MRLVALLSALALFACEGETGPEGIAGPAGSSCTVQATSGGARVVCPDGSVQDFEPAACTVVGTILRCDGQPDIQLHVEEGRTAARLAGSVRRFDGAPLFGAEVSAEGPSGRSVATTGIDGSFRFDDLPIGIHSLEVTLPPFEEVRIDNVPLVDDRLLEPIVMKMGRQLPPGIVGAAPAGDALLVVDDPASWQERPQRLTLIDLQRGTELVLSERATEAAFLHDDVATATEGEDALYFHRASQKTTRVTEQIRTFAADKGGAFLVERRVDGAQRWAILDAEAGTLMDVAIDSIDRAFSRGALVRRGGQTLALTFADGSTRPFPTAAASLLVEHGGSGRVAYFRTGPSQLRIFDFADGKEVLLDSSGLDKTLDASMLVWSPDGTRLAYRTTTLLLLPTLEAVDLGSGEAISLNEKRGDVFFSPDSRWVVYTKADSKRWARSLQTSREVSIANPDDRAFHFSPDSRYVARHHADGSWSVVDLADGSVIPLEVTTSSSAYPWAPAARLLLHSADGSLRAWSSSAGVHLLVDEVDRLEVAASGTIAVQAGREILRVDGAGFELRPVDGDAELLGFTPDGTHLALLDGSTRLLRLLDLESGRWIAVADGAEDVRLGDRMIQWRSTEGTASADDDRLLWTPFR